MFKTNNLTVRVRVFHLQVPSSGGSQSKVSWEKKNAISFNDTPFTVNKHTTLDRQQGQHYWAIPIYKDTPPMGRL